MKTPPRRVLPADVYDALEFSAEVFGGVGSDRSYEPNPPHAPVCFRGHASFLDGDEDECNAALDGAFGVFDVAGDNDKAVKALGGSDTVRVSFQALAKQLNLVRGE